MGFLQQPVVIAMLTFVAFCCFSLFGILTAYRRMQGAEKARKKEAVGLNMSQPAMQPVDDDFDLFAPASGDRNDDPLADLYNLRDDTGEVDLSALLSNIGEVPIHKVASEQVNVNLATGNTTHARELLSILRDETDGRLMVLAGDTAYRTLLNDSEVKAQFTKIMKELSAVIMQPDDNQSDDKSADKPMPTNEMPKPEVKAVANSATPKPEAKSVSDEIPVTPIVTPDKVPDVVAASEEKPAERKYIPGDLPDLKVPDNPDNYKQGRYGWVSVEKVDKAPELNIAQAIEAYLQYKIGNTPDFQRRGIHIKPTPSGGVRIEADGKSYDFVDEVADTEVRDFIQTAINEWQDRH